MAADDYVPGEEGARIGKCDNCQRWTHVVRVSVWSGLRKFRLGEDEEFLMTDRKLPELRTVEGDLCKSCVKLMDERRRTDHGSNGNAGTA
jgi:hypothetical protein